MNRYSFDLNSLSSASRIATEKLQSILDGAAQPGPEEISRLTEALNVPALFLAARPGELPKETVPDLRSFPGNVGRPISPTNLVTISRLKKLQKFATRIADEYQRDFDTTFPRLALRLNDLIEFSAEQRKIFNLTDEMQLSDSFDLVWFLRLNFERAGIITHFRSFDEAGAFRAACLLTRGAPPLVALNTNDTKKGARAFSLMHEFAHILLRQNGVSDFARADSRTEALCNSFAANFLMPKDLVYKVLREIRKETTLNEWALRRAATKLKVSHYAVAYRAYELDMVSGDFFKQFVARYVNYKAPSKGRGGGMDFYKFYINRFGPLFLSRLISAYDRLSVSTPELYQIFELKPRHLGVLGERIRLFLEGGKEEPDQ